VTRALGVARSGSLDAAAAELIEQLADRVQAGEALDLDAILRDHPEHADLLRRVLPAIGLLADLSRSARKPPGAGVEAGPLGALGDFRLIREVGRGGMGVVYEARQVSLDRRVALKVLPYAGTMDPRQLDRFRNEARAAAALHHPNVVPVHAVGCEGGVHYYAMQFIDGCNLAELIRALRRRGPAAGAARPDPDQATVPHGPPFADPHAATENALAASLSTDPALCGRAFYRTVARWGAAAAEALDHAHRLGIVHRDVKPANLLIDGTGRVWVADFGLAQFQAGGELTMTGDLVGTLRYMSPEQAAGQRVAIDERTDVYSLGVTLYEALTLEPAFPGLERQDVLRRVVNDEPPPLRSIAPGVPRDLETVVLKAMAKDPADRYQSARELADDLARWDAGEPVRARRPGRGERAWRWARRNPAVATLGAVSAVGLAVVLGLVLYFTATLETAEDRRQHAERLAQQRHRFGLLQRAAGRASSRQPGWTWDNLEDVAEAAAPPEAGEYRVELRSEALAALAAVDVRLVEPLRPGLAPIGVAADHQGRWVAVSGLGVVEAGGMDPPLTVALVDPANGHTLRTVRAPAHPLNGVRPDNVPVMVFSRDGRWLVGGTRSGRGYAWDLAQESPEPVATWDGPAPVSEVAFSPDGRWLYTGYERASQVDARPVGDWKRHRHEAGGGTFSVHPRLGWVAAPHPNGGGFGYNARLEGRVRPPFPILGDLPRFGPDGTWLAVKEDDTTVVLRDSSSWEVIRRLTPPEEGTSMPGPVTDICVGPGGDLVLTTSYIRGLVRLWETLTGSVVATLSMPQGSYSAAFTADGRWLLIVTQDEVRRYDIRRSATQRPFALGAGEVRAFGWHPAGRHVAVGRGQAGAGTGGYGGEVAIYPLPGTTEEPVVVAPVGRYTEAGSVHHVAFADGATLVSAHSLRAHHILEFHDLVGRRPAKVEQTPAKVQPHEIRGLVPDEEGTTWIAADWEVRGRRGLEEAARWVPRDDPVNGRPEATALAVGRRWLVVGCREGAVHVVPRGRGDLAEVARAALGPHNVYHAALSPDETLAVLADADGRLHVVGMPSAERRFASDRLRDGVDAVAWGRSGWVAVGLRDGQVGLLRWTGSALEPYCWLRHPRAVSRLAFSPDGTRLLVQGRGELGLRLWDLTRMTADLERLGLADGVAIAPGPASAEPLPGRVVGELPPAPMHGVLAELFSDPGLGHRVLAREETGFALPPEVWPGEAGVAGFRLAGSLHIPVAGMHAFRVERPAGLACRVWLDDLLLLDYPRTAPIDVAHDATIRLAAGPHRLRMEGYRPEGARGWELLWDTHDERRSQAAPFPALKRHDGAVHGLAYSPDGARIASGGEDGKARIWKWNGQAWQEERALAGHGGAVLSVAWSPDGRRLLTGSDDKTARLWDRLTGQEVLKLPHAQAVPCGAWSPDGRFFVTGDDAGTGQIWDARTGALLHKLSSHTQAISSVAWSPDGQRILTGSAENTVNLWKPSPGQRWTLERTYTAGWGVHSVAWAPDSTHFVVGLWSGDVLFMNRTQAAHYQALRRHDGAVHGLAYSPDGIRIASGGEDGTARIWKWNGQVWQQERALTGHGGAVLSVAWNPDGKHVLTGSKDKSTKAWDVVTGQRIAE